jgi:hypothetical protein
MQIQYYGDYCFKITTKPAGRATEDVVLWTDPCGKEVGLRAPFGQASVLMLSHANRDDDNVSGLMKSEPALLDAPGEYAAHGITALGFLSFRDGENGAIRGQNTVYAFESEGIHCCFLGALGHEMSAELIEKVNGVDILFLPIGGHDTMDSKSAADAVRKIEPKLVIPMHYLMTGMTGDFGTEKNFCTEFGISGAERISKLSIKKKDLEMKNMEVVFLERG